MRSRLLDTINSSQLSLMRFLPPDSATTMELQHLVIETCTLCIFIYVSHTYGQSSSFKCGIASNEAVATNYIFSSNSRSTQLRHDISNNFRAEERIYKADTVNSTAAFPWIAQVLYIIGGQPVYMCGAAIISEYFVLTSAKCATDTELFPGVIRVGEFNIKEPDSYEEDFEFEYVVSTFVPKDKFDRPPHDDISLVKIKPKEGRGFLFNDYVMPVCLPSADTSYLEGMLCTIAGYGNNEFGRQNKFLGVGTIPMYSDDHCQSSDEAEMYFRDGVICAGELDSTNATDVCNGDIGSPLVCKINGRYILSGVVGHYACGHPGRMSFYCDIKYRLEWINSQMEMTSTV